MLIVAVSTYAEFSGTMSRDQTIKEGLLYKRGKINTDWKQRLFILNGKQLAYFKGSVSDVILATEVQSCYAHNYLYVFSLHTFI